MRFREINEIFAKRSDSDILCLVINLQYQGLATFLPLPRKGR
jgi:hypothetical protein